MRRPALVALVVLSLAGGPLLAQSLGELADKEKERRAREKKTPAKVYTNDDLPKKGDEASKDGKKDKQGKAQPASVAPSAEADKDLEATAQARALNEVNWRRKGREHRERVRKAEQSVQEIQARLNALMVDMGPSPTDAFSPNRLQEIEARKAQARDELAKAQAELADARKAIEDLEDQARREGASPGWLREP